jgi:hypothetical protein
MFDKFSAILKRIEIQILYFLEIIQQPYMLQDFILCTTQIYM